MGGYVEDTQEIMKDLQAQATTDEKRIAKLEALLKNVEQQLGDMKEYMDTDWVAVNQLLSAIRSALDTKEKG